MILVAGSTGLLGRQVCQLLLDRGHALRALVRETSDHDVKRDLRHRGAELFVADLKNRHALNAACRSVRAVISTASSTFSRQVGDSIESVDLQGQIDLIDAATKAGVRRFVFVSFNHHRAPVSSPLAEAKAAVEHRLITSGMAYTILRASLFMEVWLSPLLGFDPLNGRVTIYGRGVNPISWISVRDVAAFVADSVDNPMARNQIIEIGGPEPLSPLETVGIFDELRGRRSELQHIPEATLRAQREAAADPVRQSLAALMLSYAAGDPVDVARAMKLYSIPLRSVRAYAEHIVGPVMRTVESPAQRRRLTVDFARDSSHFWRTSIRVRRVRM